MTDSYLPTTDGVVTAVIMTTHVLRSMGHEVFIMAPDPGPDYREEGVYYLRAIKFKQYTGYFIPIYPSIPTKLIRKINPDIIHVRGIACMALKAIVAAHFTKTPLVLTYDTVVTEVIQRYSPLKLKKETLVKYASIYLRSLLKRPSVIMVPTDCIGEELVNDLHIVSKRMETVPTGIDTSHFVNNGKGDLIREKYGLEDKRIVLFVGRLSFEKNVELVIRSIKPMDKDIVLMVVGDGPSKVELEALAEEEGLTDRVFFAGYVHGDELVDYYSCANVFVSASVFETQGFTVQEAMSTGLPVACGRGRAFAEFIRDGENGYLFDINEDDCREAIGKALDAPQCVLDASKKTAEEYGLAPMTEKLVKVYESVISQREVDR